MKRFLVALTLLVNLHNYAQINFEKGYFINNNNVKTECFIRNQDWKNNPTRFYYKISENGTSTEEKTINDVKEFGIGEFDKFERFVGLVDDSSTDINRLSGQKEPSWSKKTIFLKVIIQGDATLYGYVDGNGGKYFYSYKSAPIEQLVYKKYTEDNVAIKNNNFFQQQLFTKVKCEAITLSDIFKVKYTQPDLSKYFLTVNNCGVDAKDIVNKKINKNGIVDRRNKSTSDNFLLRAKAGIGFNSLYIDYSPSVDQFGNESKARPDFKFDGAQTFKVGLDAEYILPINKNKWSLFFDLTYQSKYESQKTVVEEYFYPNKYVRVWNVKYNCFNLGLGLRHYMFLNNNSKLFLDVAALYSPNQEAMLGNDNKVVLEIKSKPYLGLGLGYAYKRYNMEFRYASRNILDQNNYVKSKYKDLSVVLGYTLFESNKKK